MAEKGMSRKKHALAPCLKKKTSFENEQIYHDEPQVSENREQHCIFSFCCKGLIEKAMSPSKF